MGRKSAPSNATRADLLPPPAAAASTGTPQLSTKARLVLEALARIGDVTNVLALRGISDVTLLIVGQAQVCYGCGLITLHVEI